MNLLLLNYFQCLFSVECLEQRIVSVIQINLQCVYDIPLIIANQYIVHILSLLQVDNIIVTDIYAARETNTYDISSKDLVDAIVKLGKNAKYIPSLEDCASYLKEHVKENDIVLTLGAGTVTQIGPMIVES